MPPLLRPSRRPLILVLIPPGNDLELLVDAAIAERHGSADPEALALRGCNLVAHPLADHLPLELGKGEQHIEGEPAHTGSRVE